MSTVEMSPLRVDRITGSRVAAVLGVDPYETRDGVIRAMVRQHHGYPDEFQGNPATEWGQQHEADALAAYSAARWVDLHSHQLFVRHPVHDFLAVTVDALEGDERLVEAKCPWSASYTTIPDYYVPQVQLQLACTGRKVAAFVVWRESGVNITDVPADPGWLPTHLPALLEFITEYRQIVADPDLSAPYLKPLVDERTDADWYLAAVEYHEAVADEAAAAARVKAAKATLIGLAGDSRRARGVGVQVIRSERAGTVDYAKAVEKYAPDADLEDFRKPGSTVWTVRKAAVQ